MSLYNATCFDSEGIVVRQFIQNIITHQLYNFLHYTLVCLKGWYELSDDDSLGIETCSIVEWHFLHRVVSDILFLRQQFNKLWLKITSGQQIGATDGVACGYSGYLENTHKLQRAELQ